MFFFCNAHAHHLLSGRSVPPRPGASPPTARPPRPVTPGLRPPARPQTAGRAIPPGSHPPGTGGPDPSSGVPGRSSAPPGRTSGAPQRQGPSPSHVAAGTPPPPTKQRPAGSGVGPWSSGRGMLFRAEHRATTAPPGSGVGDDSIPSSLSNLTIGSRSSGGSGELVSGNGANGNGDAAATGRGSMRGARYGRDLLITRPASLQSKAGTSGQPFKCIANYFKVKQRPDWSLVQYRVDFAPEEDRTFVRKVLVKEHAHSIRDGWYIFDGTMMYTSGNIDGSDTVQFTSTRKDDGQAIQISIRKVGVVPPSSQSYFQFFNIMIRKVMEKLDLQLLGRNYYDSKAGIKLPEWKLELWMGYVTSMRQHENDVLLCCEIGKVQEFI